MAIVNNKALTMANDVPWCTYNRKVEEAAFATIEAVTPLYVGERVLWSSTAAGQSLLYQALDITTSGWQLCQLAKMSGA